IVLDAGKLLGEFGKFKVVRGEERLGPGARMQVFDGRPGDGQAVVGRGAAPDFVKEDERSWGSGIQDGGGLGHLYHKRRAPASQIVAGADAGEDAVYNREPAVRRRDEAAHL